MSNALEEYEEEYEEEAGEEEVDEEQPEQPEDIVDEIDEEPEEVVEEDEEQDDDSIIEVPYIDDATGEEMTVDVELEDLPDLIKYNIRAQDYIPKAQQWIEAKKDFVRIGEYAVNEPFLNHIIQMRLNNHPPQDIVAALFEYYQNNMNQVEEEIPLDEGARAYLQKALDQQVAPLQQKLAEQERMLAMRQNVEYNQSVIDETLEEVGYEFQPDDLPALQRAMQELFPGANTQTHQFTKRQIRAIIKESGVLDKQKPQTAKQQRVVKVLGKAKAAPRIAPGKQTTVKARNVSSSNNNSEDAQRARLLAL